MFSKMKPVPKAIFIALLVAVLGYGISFGLEEIEKRKSIVAVEQAKPKTDVQVPAREREEAVPYKPEAQVPQENTNTTNQGLNNLLDAGKAGKK